MHLSEVKKVLYFFPLNPADNNTGSCRRALGLLQYFKDRNISVDFVSKHDWGKWTTATRDAFTKLNLAENLFVFKRKPDKHNPIKYFFTYKLWHNLYEQKLGKQKASLPNHTTLYLQQQFDGLFQKNRYDLIIISYAYWADLVHDNPFVQNSITILDTHDFLTSQHQLDKDFDIGIAFADEIRRLNFFDKVWAIAPEEQYLFAQFLDRKIQYIPAWIKAPERSVAKKKFDVIYVATDNPHNLRSSNWFFDEVYPLLSKHIKILVIGTIVDHISKAYENIEKIAYVDILDEYYAQSSVAICPMLTGTGVKIKIIEAMASGLPVVCNLRGLDGMPSKIDNGCLVADNPTLFAEYIQKLLNDEVYYNKHAAMARHCYEKMFTKEIGYQKLDEAIADMLQQKKPTV